MLVNTIFLVSLCLITLPLYSVTVQMGGDYKASLMPKDVIDNAARAHSLQVCPLAIMLCVIWHVIETWVTCQG